MQTLRPRFSLCKTRRGSALVGTLVMVGILAMAVGVMISSSNSAIRGSRDKILYEEAYQAALSGTHATRAWMIDSEKVGDMTGDGSLETHIDDLVLKGLEVSDKIIFDRERDIVSNHYGTARFSAAGFDMSGPTLPDGRKVLFQFGSKADPVVSFINDADNKKFTENIFNNGSAKGHRNYVERIRITTPPTDPATSVPLTQTTFIIESYGVAEYAGTRKERMVMQHVLLYPKRPSAPLLSAGESIITKAGMTIQAKSHANVHWAPVLAKGDIELEFLNGLKKTVAANGTVSWELSTVTGIGKKFNGAGINTVDPNFPDTGVLDEWLRWMAGSQGRLEDVNGNNLFAQVVPPLDTNGKPIPVSDFFAQVKQGLFNDANNKLFDGNLSLTGQYAQASPKATTMANPNGIYTEKDGAYQGALVQGSPDVDTKVDQFFSTMNYAELKDYAKDHGGYYVFDGVNLFDSVGRPVPADKWPDMIDQVSSGFDPLSPTAAPDRILFIDSVGDKNNTEPVAPFTGIFPMPEFWKGVMYINGSVASTGTGSSPDIQARTPTEFKNYRTDGSSATHEVDHVLVDGILICNGIAELGGNTAIYGTLAAQKGVGLGGTPSVFYNSANGEGRMKSDLTQSAEFRLIAGRLHE